MLFHDFKHKCDKIQCLFNDFKHGHVSTHAPIYPPAGAPGAPMRRSEKVSRVLPPALAEFSGRQPRLLEPEVPAPRAEVLEIERRVAARPAHHAAGASLERGEAAADRVARPGVKEPSNFSSKGDVLLTSTQFKLGQKRVAV